MCCCLAVLAGYCVCRLACKIISAIISILVLAGLIVLIVLLTKPSKSDKDDAKMYIATEYSKAAISANGYECADIGMNIFDKGGSAADAAIATMLCEGVTCPQCAGLGGGFLMTVYTRATGKVEVLNAREVAPDASLEQMFGGGILSTTEGGLVSAVPGELRGYGELHKKYGKLPWHALVQPSIDLCLRGFQVNGYMASVLKENKYKILDEPSLKELYIDHETGDVWHEGDLVIRSDLAQTLTIIAGEGPDALHKGSLTKPFLDDVRKFGGIITEHDMNNYQPRWLEPISVSLGREHQMFTVPLPGAGPQLSFIINTLRGWAFPENVGEAQGFQQDSATSWHRTIETLKYANAKRTGLADPTMATDDKIQSLVKNLTSQLYANDIRKLISDFETHEDWSHYGPEFAPLRDFGGAHVSVLAENGDAISVTTSINHDIGAYRGSTSTGIVLNNVMDAFAYPGMSSVRGLNSSPRNFVKSGKNPISSMAPSIVVQKGRGARMVLGAAGSTEIPAQLALVVLKHLLLEESLEKVMADSRLHHPLFPMEVHHETDFDKAVLKRLQDIGHKTIQVPSNNKFSTVNVISVDRTTGKIDAQYDRRRPGSHAGM